MVVLHKQSQTWAPDYRSRYGRRRIRSAADELVATPFAVAHQAILAKRLAHADYGSVTGLPTANLTKRPFLLFWFMALIERYVVKLCGYRARA